MPSLRDFFMDSVLGDDANPGTELLPKLNWLGVNGLRALLTTIGDYGNIMGDGVTIDIGANTWTLPIAGTATQFSGLRGYIPSGGGAQHRPILDATDLDTTSNANARLQSSGDYQHFDHLEMGRTVAGPGRGILISHAGMLVEWCKAQRGTQA